MLTLQMHLENVLDSINENQNQKRKINYRFPVVAETETMEKDQKWEKLLPENRLLAIITTDNPRTEILKILSKKLKQV